MQSLSNKLSLWTKMEFWKNVVPFPINTSLKTNPENMVSTAKVDIGIRIKKLDSLAFAIIDLWPLYEDKNTHQSSLTL